MRRYLSDTARQSLRDAIAAAGGNEVFFVGETDAQCCVIQAAALARGTRDAVPALLQAAAPGRVVIHNHPSGDLTPSAADLDIAARLGALGVGFLIIDNHAGQLYAVVEPFAPRPAARIEPEEIAELLGPDGRIARSLPGYEERPEQLRMAFAVASAFNDGLLGTIEAGTGTGKSLAYLVPALLWARRNQERVVISTNTLNLQEQLIRKDLPFLERASGLEFRAELVKGRSNYLCRRRAAQVQDEPGLFDEEWGGELRQLLAWAAQTADGSREDLPFLPADLAWEELCCEADQCLRARCGRFGDCFFHQARRRAAQADLLVVNHALLLSDLAVRSQTDNYSAAAVLPPFDRLILDEAHHLEENATRALSVQVTRFALARVLGRLRHPRKPERGLLPRLLALLARELPDGLDQLYRELHALIETRLQECQTLHDQALLDLERIGETLATHLGARPEAGGEGLRQRLIPVFRATPAWAEIEANVRRLGVCFATAGTGIRQLLQATEQVPQEHAPALAALQTDLAGIAGRLETLAAELALVAAAPASHCTWLEVVPARGGRSRQPLTRLCSAPLEVATSLRTTLFERYRTVILTSATLAVGASFDYFWQRIGLDRCEASRRLTLQLPSPFDFPRQALLAVPTDLPAPGEAGFAGAVRDLVERAILAADGRTFVLFTAYGLLRQVHAELAPILEARGYACLRQGDENRHRLLKRFTATPTSTLFATDSFWEGVDVPGRALEQVIITRLPFRVPTEPVQEARAEAISAAGGDPFMDYTVPQAIIRFKQGFGRLIRHRDDRGVVLILDTRVVSRSYGRIFLRSLPAARRLTAPADQVIAGVAAFLAGDRPAAAAPP